MIIFNGQSLTSVAPVDVVDILVSPIQRSATVRPRAVEAGSEFVRIRNGTRTVQIIFALLTNDKNRRQAQLMAINQWAVSAAESSLILPNYPEMYLNCICTSCPEPSTRQWWESKLRLVFTAYDNPYWTSIQEKQADCGTAFFVGGGVEPLMRICNTFAASANNIVYSDGSNTMTFTTIPAGNMVIDLNRQTAQVGTNSIMSAYTLGSYFVRPRVGWQTITGTGIIKYRERWY